MEKEKKTLLEIIEKEIQDLNDQIKEKREIIDLIKKFPKLKRHVNRWNNVRYSSSEINHVVTNCEIRHSCGCCDDPAIEVWPFTIINEIKIYSDPLPFYVGQKNGYGYGEIPNENWREEMENENIPQIVIKKVQEFFDSNPESYDDDE